MEKERFSDGKIVKVFFVAVADTKRLDNLGKGGNQTMLESKTINCDPKDESAALDTYQAFLWKLVNRQVIFNKEENSMEHPLLLINTETPAELYTRMKR
jgi:hypothetical protein